MEGASLAEGSWGSVGFCFHAVILKCQGHFAFCCFRTSAGATPPPIWDRTGNRELAPALAEPEPGGMCRSQHRARAEPQCYSQERRQLCFQCVSSAVLPPELLRAPHHHFYSTADNSLPYFLSLRTLCSKHQQDLPGI